MTSDQRLFLNFLISLLISAVYTGLQAGYQYSVSNSVVNIGTLILVSVAMFSVSFGHGLYAYVPAHITEEIQALHDTINDFTQPATPVSQAVVPPQTSVVIHANHVTVPTSAPVPESADALAATTSESVNAASPLPGDIVSDTPLTPAGVTTQELAGEKTQKIAVVKASQVTAPLAQG